MLRRDYRTGRDNLVNDFYVPCLAYSSRYDRAVGYFTADGLSLAARGISELIRNGGIIRLVFGALVKEQDRDEIVKGYEQKILHVLDAKLDEELDKVRDGTVRARIESLAWLISNGALEIKVATRLDQIGRISKGIYHEKMGIFSDIYGEAVAFTGSSNETEGGLVSNFESNDVYRSWDSSELERVKDKIAYFEDLWNNKTTGLLILDFTAAARAKLLRFRPTSPSETDPESAGNMKLMSPYPFQLRAVEAWKKAGYRGVLAMATGTGKTFTTLFGIQQLSGLRICVIVVPVKDLIEQWNQEIRAVFGIEARVRLASGENPGWRSSIKRVVESERDSTASRTLPYFVLTTYATSSKEDFLSNFKGFPPEKLAVVLDEAHHAGAATYRKIFDLDASYRVGLSATPENEWDEDRNQLLFDYLGPTVFSYDIADAIHDKILCPYKYYIHPVSLTPGERENFRGASADIAAILQRVKRMYPNLRNDSSMSILQQLSVSNPSLATRLRGLYLARVAILRKATTKAEELRKVASQNTLNRCVVYCNDVQHGKESTRILFDLGFEATEYSSSINPVMKRRQILDSFEEPGNSTKFLVAIKCLDEGINLPIMNSAILVSSSKSTREFTQRRGRVLRKHKDKPFATIHDIIVLPFTSPDEAYAISQSELEYVRAELHRVEHFGKNALNKNEIDVSSIIRMFEKALQ